MIVLRFAKYSCLKFLMILNTVAHPSLWLSPWVTDCKTDVWRWGAGDKGMATLTTPGLSRLFSKSLCLSPTLSLSSRLWGSHFSTSLLSPGLVGLKLCYQLDGCELVSPWCFIHIFFTAHEADSLCICFLALWVASPENVFHCFCLFFSWVINFLECFFLFFLFKVLILWCFEH